MRRRWSRILGAKGGMDTDEQIKDFYCHFEPYEDAGFMTKQMAGHPKVRREKSILQ